MRLRWRSGTSTITLLSRSLTHPAGNLNNKPAARNDHAAQPEMELALSRFALKPLALGLDRNLLVERVTASQCWT